MTWFRADDSLPTHRKVLSIPRGARRVAAMGTWVLAGTWCAANLTEGHIPAGVVDDLGLPARAVADLVAARLWHPTDGGYAMHDYLDYNPTKEQVERERAAARKRQQRARETAKSQRSHAVTNGEVTAGVTVPPTRPDPTRPVVDSSVDQKPSPPLPAQRQPAEDPVDRLVRKLSDFYLVPYPENEALRTARFITDGKKLDDPVRYVMAAVQRDPDRYKPSVATPTPDHRKADYGPPPTDEQREAAAKAAQQAKAALRAARSA